MKTNSNLEFRKVPSLNFLYEINENGTILRNVKSKKQIKIVLDYHHSKQGYYKASVCIKGKVRRVMIHKTVAECWLGEKPKDMEIDHIDRNSHNNHYSNLRYVNHNEQMKNRKLKRDIIIQASMNCYNYTMKYVAIPVQIKSSTDFKIFNSLTDCARYMGNVYNVKPESIRAKLKKRRKRIFDYDITYLRNAETRHTNSTE